MLADGRMAIVLGVDVRLAPFPVKIKTLSGAVFGISYN
jgi:hypothetical protein